MENRYPLFAGGRILKKEALWDLRDYAYGSLQLSYADYTDGILKGCRVRVEGEEMVVGRGMLKCGDFIHLIQKEERVPYQAENRRMVLKAAISGQGGNPDYMSYQVKFFLDDETELSEGQIELCSFHLREGSQLRDTYKDFADMETEYDTINLFHATLAGREAGRLHPQILLKFAKEMQERGTKNMEDYAFCYEIWNTAGELERNVVEAYLADKEGRPMREGESEWDSESVFRDLGRILGQRFRQDRSGWKQDVLYVE